MPVKCITWYFMTFFTVTVHRKWWSETLYYLVCLVYILHEFVIALFDWCRRPATCQGDQDSFLCLTCLSVVVYSCSWQGMVVEQLPKVCMHVCAWMHGCTCSTHLLTCSLFVCLACVTVLACWQWLVECCQKVASLGVFGEQTPNHVLVNEYTPGQGIMVRNFVVVHFFVCWFCFVRATCKAPGPARA